MKDTVSEDTLDVQAEGNSGGGVSEPIETLQQDAIDENNTGSVNTNFKSRLLERLKPESQAGETTDGVDDNTQENDKDKGVDLGEFSNVLALIDEKAIDLYRKQEAVTKPLTGLLILEQK